MNTYQLRCFLAVAEYLNFTKAAEHLHVTHPAVSQQIRNLEKELNTTLFDRSTRSVKLTSAGHIFLGDARQMLEIAGRAKRRFSDPLHDSIETLSLGTNNFPTLFRLTNTLAALRREHPTLHPRLHVIPFQHIFRRLDEGDLDAIITFRETTRNHAIYKELTQAPLICLCTSDHPLAAAGSITLDQLRDTPLVSITPPHTSMSIISIQGSLMGERPSSDFYFCDSVEATTALVSAGYGVSVLPNIIAPDHPPLVQLPIIDATPISFGIYYRSLTEKPLLAAFIQEMLHYFHKKSDPLV